MEKTTVIYNTSFVVGCENDAHYLLKNGEVAYKGNEVIYVGSHFSGQADEKIDAQKGIVIPGLINLHAHIAGSPLEKGFIEDEGNPFHYMSGLYEYLSVARLEPEDQDDVLRFSLADIMTRGTTTVFEQGACTDNAIQIMGESGLRVIVGPHSASGHFLTKDGRTVYYEMDEANAFKRLEYTMDVYEQYHGAYDGRMSVAINLGQVDCCTEEFLDEAAKTAASKSGGILVAIHAGQSISEYTKIAADFGCSPAQHLYNHGIVGENVHYGHYIMPSGHSMNAMKIKGELELIASTKTSVIHCPWVFSRRGMIMESLQKYLDIGINMGLGTDTFPQDMMLEMRYAASFGKVGEGGNPHTCTAAQVFNIATLGGAKAINRPDLGRIQEGCKADIVIVGTRNLNCIPLRDPIKVLVYSANHSNIDRVIVDGEVLVKDHIPCGVDLDNLYDRMQKSQEKMLEKAPQRDWNHRTHEEMSPMSFPVRK